MPKRLETQLEELKAFLAERQTILAAAQKEHSAAIAAAEKKKDTAEERARVVSEELSKLEKQIETENKIMIYQSKKRGDEFDDCTWHPNFLKRVAAVVGVHYDERAEIDPKNRHDSLYEQALWVLRNNMTKNHPEIQKLYTLEAKADEKVRDVRREHSIACRPVDEAERYVRSAERDVKDLELKIARQRAVTPTTPEDRKIQEQEDARAKRARDKLREIAAGKLVIPLEPSS